MMTEEELKDIEVFATTDRGPIDEQTARGTLLEMLEEIRRLNAAYRHILSIFKSVPELALAWLSTFLAFEPEECGKWMGELARAADDLDKMKKS